MYFATAGERSAFRELIKVSGIGARTALSVLSGLSVADLAQAITLQESGRLTAPGIGKKTAERLPLEMRGKLGADIGAQAHATPDNQSHPERAAGAGLLEKRVAVGAEDAARRRGRVRRHRWRSRRWCADIATAPAAGATDSWAPPFARSAPLAARAPSVRNRRYRCATNPGCRATSAARRAGIRKQRLQAAQAHRHGPDPTRMPAPGGAQAHDLAQRARPAVRPAHRSGPRRACRPAPPSSRPPRRPHRPAACARARSPAAARAASAPGGRKGW